MLKALLSVSIFLICSLNVKAKLSNISGFKFQNPRIQDYVVVGVAGIKTYRAKGKEQFIESRSLGKSAEPNAAWDIIGNSLVNQAASYIKKVYYLTHFQSKKD